MKCVQQWNMLFKYVTNIYSRHKIYYYYIAVACVVLKK